MKSKSGLIKGASLFQVMILVVGTIAFSMLMGASFGADGIGRKVLEDIGADNLADVLGEEMMGGVYGDPLFSPNNYEYYKKGNGRVAIPKSGEGQSYYLSEDSWEEGAWDQDMLTERGYSPLIRSADTPTTLIPVKSARLQKVTSVTAEPTSFNVDKALDLTKPDGNSLTVPQGTKIVNGKFNLAGQQYSWSSAEINSKLVAGDLKYTGNKNYFFEEGGKYYGIRRKGSPEFASNDFSKTSNPDVFEFGDKASYLESKSVSETGEGPGFGEAGGWFGEGTFRGALFAGVKWGAAVGGALYMIGGLIGPENSNMGQALGVAGFAGAFAGKAVYEMIKPDGIFGTTAGKGINPIGDPGLSNTGAGWWGAGIGIVVGALIFMSMYKETKTEIVEYTCYAWDAPTGGANCEQCNEMSELYGVPCSEYQCRSLGQGCGLVNEGNEESLCVWLNPHDVEYPTIQAWEEALTDDYSYTPDKAISPPDRGVQIKYDLSTSGNIRPFTPLSFGIILNEPAACKIDTSRKKNYEEMAHFFGGTQTLKYNHTMTMSLPGPSALRAENITIQNGGKYDLYIRCRDANGNENPANFVINFEVEDGPDTTPPLIVSTSTINGAPIAYNQTKHDVVLYTNEPAQCKWSRLNQKYDKMENEMSCSNSVRQMNSQMLYECETSLDGLKNNEANEYYFRCKDKAEIPNENQESYKFTLMGTRPLVMNSLAPEQGEIVKDATDPVKVTLEVKTSAGYQEGESICYYSTTGNRVDELEFFNSHSFEHSQELWLPEGIYTYYYRCVDLGGNAVSNSTTFEVESDSEPPMIVRAYHEESYLKIVTDEEATCVYDNVACDYNFEDGNLMVSLEDEDNEKTNHFTDWNPNKAFYIKCKDKNDLGPEPNNVCTMIVRASKSI
jgi:hypothetical protein